MTFSGTIIVVKILRDTHFCTQMRYGLTLGRNALRILLVPNEDLPNPCSEQNPTVMTLVAHFVQLHILALQIARDAFAN
jgi:hypothetical protein